MDINNENRMAASQLMAETGSKRMIAGAKQLRKAITKGRASCVYVAENADPAITEPIIALCKCKSVSYAWVPTMTDLGHACGIDVGAAAAAAVD